MSFLQNIYYPIMVIFIICCLLLMLLVLIQKGRGGGLASAFGGGGGHTPFGNKTGDVLTWTTSILFGVFILLAILLNWSTNARNAAATPATATMPAPTDHSMVMPVDGGMSRNA